MGGITGEEPSVLEHHIMPGGNKLYIYRNARYYNNNKKYI
jgi:hypothetical protein